MILFYSATGNTEYVARELARQLEDECVDLLPRIKKEDHSVLHSEKPFVLCAPVYVCEMPRFLSKYLKAQTFAGSREVYCVFTSGGYCGISGPLAKSIFRKKGMVYRGHAEVKMPRNYVANDAYPMLETEEIAARLRNARAQLVGIAAAIRVGRKLTARHVFLLESVITLPFNPVWCKFKLTARDFFTTDQCIGCGKCVNLCPLNNITLKDKVPVWGDHCTHCMACIGNCPAEAIEYGTITQKKEPYNLGKYRHLLEEPSGDGKAEDRAGKKARGQSKVRVNGRWMLTCEECGNYVDQYSKTHPHCNLLGETLCLSCFNRKKKNKTVVCKACQKEIPYLDAKNHRCPDCWKERLGCLRAFYEPYHVRLAEDLQARGISVRPVSTRHLDDLGRAVFPILPVPGECLPLRKNTKGWSDGDECGVFTAETAHGIFAIPDNGIGIRYLKGSLDQGFMARAEALGKNGLLALASDGTDLYGLDNRGMVLSTRQDWEAYPLFNVMEEIRAVVHEICGEEQIRSAVSLFETGIQEDISSDIKYDCQQKAFIQRGTTGSSHDGIYEEYWQISLPEVLDQLTRWEHLRDIAESAAAGKIPAVVIAERLPVHEPGIPVTVPETRWVY